MASFDQTPVMKITKILFEGLLRIWNLDYDIWLKTLQWGDDKFFGENGSFLAWSVLELLKPDRLRRKRKKKTGKTIVHSKAVVLITIIIIEDAHLDAMKFRAGLCLLWQVSVDGFSWKPLSSQKLCIPLILLTKSSHYSNSKISVWGFAANSVLRLWYLIRSVAMRWWDKIYYSYCFFSI